MADYIIKADTEQIRSTTDAIESQRAYMEGYMNDMQSKINELQSYFKSKAGENFVSKYANVSKNINNCLANLSAEIASLRNAAGILDTGAQKVDSNVGMLSDADVFPNKG